jgi:hypothetical protein
MCFRVACNGGKLRSGALIEREQRLNEDPMRRMSVLRAVADRMSALYQRSPSGLHALSFQELLG